MPNWVDLFGRPGFPWRRELVIYRSRTNGTWQLSPWEVGTGAVSGRDLRTAAPRGPRRSTAARASRRRWIGGARRMVLTYVPTPRPLGGGPALFAELLDVPLVTDAPGRAC